MEEILVFGTTVILISISGVMSPGPLFAANIVYGLRDGLRAGIKMAYGHTIVEFPLIILLGVGFISLESFPQFRILISILGALGLFAFAGLQIRTVFQHKEIQVTNVKNSPILAGIMLSALNPFFIIWWLTIGFKLISDAMSIWSFAGIGILFGFHIWMDYVWLGSVAFLSKKSSKWISNKTYKLLIIALSGLLIYFGFSFILDALTAI